MFYSSGLVFMGQCYKTFSVRNLRTFVFVPGKPFQPSLLIQGDARSVPLSGAPQSLD
jgi:hypothetical protein